MRNFGFLDKSIIKEYELLEDILKNTDFFVLPTRQEAQGISYAEACSWGIPVIATNTGGVSGIVKNKINGLIFESHDNAEKYVTEMIKYIYDSKAYIELSKRTYNYFIDNLTWDAVGKKINNILNKLLIESRLK